jgi:hypothetical protein
MVPFKYVVVGAIEKSDSNIINLTRKHLLADPREGAEDRNDYKDVGDHTGGYHGVGLDSVVPYDIDDFEN